MPRIEPAHVDLNHAIVAGGPRCRFAVLHWPDSAPRGLFVQVHALGEEMNKSRRMMALQARALARAGHLVMQLDLLGCGDSPGRFAEATWADWLEDVVTASAWLRRRFAMMFPGVAPPPLTLWGLRAGTLLACEAATRTEASRLLLWQPVTAGKLLLLQFLRLAVAADLSARGSGPAGEPPSDGVIGEANGKSSRTRTEALKQRLLDGEAVEIAGYTLSPGLATGLETARLVQAPAGVEVVWLECSPREAPALLPASQATVAAWQQAGSAIQAEAVRGPAFWQTTEVEEAPALLQATLRALRIRTAPGHAEPMGSRLAALGPQTFPDTRPSDEFGVAFGVGQDLLLGIVHRPAVYAASTSGSTGVLVVVGGPQYRAGSHRQFVHLARHLAAQGHAVLRFDVRGMGDSTGAQRSFEALSGDIGAAIDALQQQLPEVRQVVLWGLCDGASAALLYVDETADPRVAGLALANPWVRTAQTLARTQIRHYYLDRIRQRDFWHKLLRGQVAAQAARGLWRNLRSARGGFGKADAHHGAGASFPDRMARAWRSFGGPVLLLLSGRDYTAREFEEAARTQPAWSTLLGRPGIQRVDLAEADHTFSGEAARQQVARATHDWLARLGHEADDFALPQGIKADAAVHP